MPAPRRPLTAATASVVLLVSLAGLTGCGGDDSAEPDAEPAAEVSDAESDSPSPDVTEAADEEQVAEAFPLPKAPKAANTPASRKEFTEFVVERWGYALATNDAEAVTDLGPKDTACKGCKELEKELENRRKEGWNVDFPGATVKKVTVTPAGAAQTFDSVATIDIPESQSYFEDGSYRNDNKAFRDAEFSVQMRWSGGRYVLLSYTLE